MLPPTDTGGTLTYRQDLVSGVLERIINFWRAKELDLSYRDALVEILTHLWPTSSGIEGKGSNSQLHILPFLCCRALGGETRAAFAVNAAWSLLYAAFYLLDKVEDQETDDLLFSRTGVNTVTNLTTGLILGAESILFEWASEESIHLSGTTSLLSFFNQMALSVCAGQHLDLTVGEPDLLQVWQITTAKSGEFFALGCLVGAISATNDKVHLERFKAFGQNLGILVQIANDIDGLWEKGGKRSDLAANKRTLPIAYAFRVLPPDKKSSLHKLVGNSSADSEAEVEARRMILDCGALIYLWLEIEKYRQKAEKNLAGLNLCQAEKEQLLDILYKVARIEPNRKA